MLTLHPTPSPAGAAGATLAEARWIDLLDPTEEERARVEEALGLRVPTKAEISEIETTSRLRSEEGALYMSAPLISVAENGAWVSAPTGFVLGRHALLTVRFAPLRGFELVARELDQAAKVEPAPAFARLLEEVVDRAADRLELLSEGLDQASAVIFQEQQHDAPRRSRDAHLRRAMTQIGQASERIARVRYALTSVDRMAKFAADHGRDWVAADVLDRLGAVRTDIASLVWFDESLVSRVQLLQDASSAIINIGQNEVMKVLTVVSVAGVPPVLIAGIYGMNFKNMPELNWPWGYAYGLALIVISTVIPLIWFRLKDWI
jgi:magnesium transporter